jgi:hypothetical protein
MAPITRATHVALREAVLDLKEHERRRHFPVALRAGVPGPASWAYVVERGEQPDQALRTEVAAALLLRCREAEVGTLLWLTRPGDLNGADADAAWGAAVRAAAAEAGLPVDFVVVTRDGWRDPASGVERRWRRLRRSSTPPGESGDVTRPLTRG